MDIFIQNVPSHANNVELRIFLKDQLKLFDILAYDIFKKVGNEWAILTVGHADKGRKFLAQYGNRGTTPLLYRSAVLACKQSNRRGQPEALKVVSLLQKEERMKAKLHSKACFTQTAGLAQATLPFWSLMTGVWDYDHLGKLIFDQKFKDRRRGHVVFGKSMFVLYLETLPKVCNWHGRIDVPYAIIEHAVPSVDNGLRGSITFTLKSPQKLYWIHDTEDLHLYTGKEPAISDGLTRLANLTLSTGKRAPRLERLCTLHEQNEKNSALCMVYKLGFLDVPLAHQAWTFVRDFGVPDAHCWKTMVPNELTQTIEVDYSAFELAISSSKLHFNERFQLLALVLEGTIAPAKALDLLPYMAFFSSKHGSTLTASAIKQLGIRLPTPGPHVGASEFRTADIRSMMESALTDAEKFDMTYKFLQGNNKQIEHLALTYKATITPTGLLLRGPDWTVSNRVLRRYAQNSDSFLRVFFADEDGLSVFHDSRASQAQIYARFGKVLRSGITIAGRIFEFLGFSHASLRCHQAWFMAPIVQDGKIMRAKDVIRELGDFMQFTCSAKCAARIGQAFSDTIFAVPIPSTAFVTEAHTDVKKNGRTFSDGCGVISKELLEQVWRALSPNRREKTPTVLQIRYRGAKGVVSLNSSLGGQQLLIRDSMTKYAAAEGWRDLELCSAAYKPLRMYLNHQFIKILEDLNVPLQNFIGVQNDARATLELVIKHPLNAASFLEYSHSGVHAKVPRLFELMHYIGLSFQADRFLTDIVEVAAMSNLRDLKYRARIPVEKGYLLFGIMDETNYLKEGEVYIALKEQKDSGRWERSALMQDRVAVTRAPALHPGDVQIVSAVNVPNTSPLRDLDNCIVFSQQGHRDLPSQLSGGDLDGDLFHIIYDTRLIPPPGSTVPPANYAAAVPRNLGRSVTVDDIAEFFVDFMISDRLGQISNMHKIRADKAIKGTHDDDCIALAKLASDAVDFSKSGVPADLTRVSSKNDRLRPDFMSPGNTFVLNEFGRTEIEEADQDDVDDPDRVSILDPDKSQIRYYRGTKALGHLYRNIDEKQFFNRMKAGFEAQRNTFGSESLVQKLDRYIDREAMGLQWSQHVKFAEDLREYYEANMVDIMDSLRAHRDKSLTELEVFSGNILGKKERASTRYIRAANQEVQERFNRDVSAIVRSIAHGNEGEDEDDDIETLPRAIACWKVALETKGWENQVLLRSWKYVTAAVCLEELLKFRGGLLKRL